MIESTILEAATTLTEAKSKAGKAARGIWYHGAQPKNLKSILSQGLKAVANKNWNQDKDANRIQIDRTSYGGVYVTKNLMTALSSSTGGGAKGAKDGSLIIIMDLQPKSLAADEDSFARWMADVSLEGMRWGGLAAAILWFAMMNMKIPDEIDIESMSRDEYYDYARSRDNLRFYNEAWESYKNRFYENYRIFNNNPKVSPEKKKAAEPVLKDAFHAAIKRMAGYFPEEYGSWWKSDWHRQYSAVDPKAKQDEVPDPPNPKEGEAEFRKAVDKITKIFKDPVVTKQGSMISGRSLSDIKFSGSNRIIAIAEVNTNDSGTHKLIVHYGNLPNDFFDQWKERWGSNLYVVDRNGRRLPQYDKHEIVKQEIERKVEESVTSDQDLLTNLRKQLHTTTGKEKSFIRSSIAHLEKKMGQREKPSRKTQHGFQVINDKPIDPDIFFWAYKNGSKGRSTTFSYVKAGRYDDFELNKDTFIEEDGSVTHSDMLDLYLENNGVTDYQASLKLWRDAKIHGRTYKNAIAVSKKPTSEDLKVLRKQFPKATKVYYMNGFIGDPEDALEEMDLDAILDENRVFTFINSEHVIAEHVSFESFMATEGVIGQKLIEFLRDEDEEALEFLRLVDKGGMLHKRPDKFKFDDREVEEMLRDWIKEKKDIGEKDFDYIDEDEEIEPNDLKPGHKKKFLDYIQNYEEVENERIQGDWSQKYIGQFTQGIYSGPFRVVPNSELLVHFTNSNPIDVASGGFTNGVTVDHIAISSAQHASEDGDVPGIFSFAFEAEGTSGSTAGISGGNQGSGTGSYGSNAIFFYADDAMEAHHDGDYELQVIFDRRKTRDRIPATSEKRGKELEWTVNDKQGKEVFKGGYEDLLEWIQKEYPSMRAKVGYQGHTTESVNSSGISEANSGVRDNKDYQEVKIKLRSFAKRAFSGLLKLLPEFASGDKTLSDLGEEDLKSVQDALLQARTGPEVFKIGKHEYRIFITFNARKKRDEDKDDTFVGALVTSTPMFGKIHISYHLNSTRKLQGSWKQDMDDITDHEAVHIFQDSQGSLGDTMKGNYYGYLSNPREVEAFIVSVVTELLREVEKDPDISFSKALSKSFYWNLYEKNVFQKNRKIRSKMLSKITNWWNSSDKERDLKIRKISRIRESIGSNENTSSSNLKKYALKEAGYVSNVPNHGSFSLEEANSYEEIEFVCWNKEHPDSSDLDSMKKLYNNLVDWSKSNPGKILPYMQDFRYEYPPQVSLAVVLLDDDAEQVVKDIANKAKIKIDLRQDVSHRKVDEIINGTYPNLLDESVRSLSAWNYWVKKMI